MAKPSTDPENSFDEPTAEQGSAPAASGNASGKQEPRQFLKTARRDLSEEELSSPAARRFLIAEIERLDGRCDDLRAVEVAYNELRVSHARLEESSKADSRLDILSYVATAVGSAGIGAAPSFISVSTAAANGWIILVFAAILLLAGVFVRLKK